MNQSDKEKSNQIKKLKSDADVIFDDAERELKKLLAEAQKLAEDLQRQNEQTDKI